MSRIHMLSKFGGGLCVLASVVTTLSLMADYRNELREIKKEIGAKAPEKYEQLVGQEKSGKNISWRKELKFIDDSIRIDSIARRAYFEGAQMVRDSVKAASKAIK